MASAGSVPMIHRQYAEKVPDGLRTGLSVAELAARCKEMAAIDRHASVPGIENEIALHLSRRKKQIANAMPVIEYLQRRREVSDKINGSGTWRSAAPTGLCTASWRLITPTLPAWNKT